jgi:VCBS repeat-containing protein
MQFSASTTVPRFVTDLLSRLRLQANGDAYATGEDAGFTFTSADLLANDGGVTKSFVSLQATSAMGATISGQNGVFTYDAGARFDYLGEGETALDSFTYTIRDAKGETSTATVLVTVTGENDAVTLDDPLPMPARIIELPDGDRSEDTSVRDVSGSFAFGDADLSDAHVLSVTPRGGGYLGTFEAHLDGARAVAWDFSVLDRALAPLGAGETLTQSYDVTVSDDLCRSRRHKRRPHSVAALPDGRRERSRSDAPADLRGRGPERHSRYRGGRNRGSSRQGGGDRGRPDLV